MEDAGDQCVMQFGDAGRGRWLSLSDPASIHISALPLRGTPGGERLTSFREVP